MKELIVEFFNSYKKPISIDNLYKKLELKSSSEFTELVKTINQLVEDGIIISNEANEFGLYDTFSFAKGIIDVKDGGFAFVDTEIGGIFIRKSDCLGAITYDEVLVKYRYDKIGRLEGKVEKILKRNTRFIIGSLFKYKYHYVVKSIDSKISVLVFIKDKDLLKARLNDIVKVEIKEFFPNNTADGVVREVIGNKYIPGLDISSMVLSSGVSSTFSKEVKNLAKTFSNKLDSDSILKNNHIVDKRNELVITIDGDDAKDLDDAISLKYCDNGNYLLTVYIADVSYYVKENDLIDQEALIRGTSIYLPDRVIPMLPKELSNGICSLNEGVDRLVLYCEMEIDFNGDVVEYSIKEAVINNKHRMTYSDVNRMIEEKDVILRNKYYDIYPMLKMMKELAHLLKEKRINKGAFMFESKEPKLVLDNNGVVKDIIFRESRTAENLIEEFMLITNETVAKAMSWLNVPFIYRVHEEPSREKLDRLISLLDLFGYSIKIKNKKSLPKKLQEVSLLIDEDENKNIKIILSKLIIRSMSKAKYQDYNIGHFGLASECYTHFTSPIRRYPDLMVHRLIKQFLLGIDQINVSNKVTYFENKVNISAISSSNLEKKAEKLERDSVDYKIVEYASNLIKQKFNGIISSITNFGIYVTLDNSMECLVKFNEMVDDYYNFDELKGKVVGEKHQKSYCLGDEVLIEIINTDLEKRSIFARFI